jgi:CHAP domain
MSQSEAQQARIERAATLLRRLIVDPATRAMFRGRPAETARRFGLDDLADELGVNEKALHTLEIRESKSALAGLLLAAAAEGVAAVEYVRGVEDRLDGESAKAARRALTQAGLNTVARKERSVPGRASPPNEAPAADPSGPSRMRNTARPLPAVVPGDRSDPAPAIADTALATDPSEAGGYPGDEAPQPAIAAWMAGAARQAGLPPELPVMAALQESGLRNLRGGHLDSVGFFQMRGSIWNTGEYRGYLDRPELQLRWFIDHAVEVRRRDPGAYEGPDDYGEWVADVELPAAEYRDRYQGHLAHARELIEAGEGRPVPTAAPGVRQSAASREVPPAAAPMRPGMMRNTEVALPSARPGDPAVDGSLPPAGGSPRLRMVDIARREVGVSESPSGSNESPRIAEYRSATAGAPGPGPWCAYFVSWVAHEAGVPLGTQGEGFGSVDAVWAWASEAGRAVPAHDGGGPRPGYLILWDEHIGLVEKVLPDGRIQTIEGNSSDHVARRVYSAGEPIVGFVRMP